MDQVWSLTFITNLICCHAKFRPCHSKYRYRSSPSRRVPKWGSTNSWMLTRASFPGYGIDSSKPVQRITAKGVGRPRITTPGQDRYIRVFHLRNRIVAASTTLQPEYLDCEESGHKQSTTGFDSMALDPEGRISERYWRRHTDVKESVGTTD
jgi:hypothetical protein